jgi:hypothetical protein
MQIPSRVDLHPFRFPDVQGSKVHSFPDDSLESRLIILRPGATPQKCARDTEQSSRRLTADSCESDRFTQRLPAPVSVFPDTRNVSVAIAKDMHRVTIQDSRTIANDPIPVAISQERPEDRRLKNKIAIEQQERTTLDGAPRYPERIKRVRSRAIRSSQATRAIFDLQRGSSATDAGANTGISSDRDGVSRPQGAGFDFGAYEFVRSKGPVAPPNVKASAK